MRALALTVPLLIVPIGWGLYDFGHVAGRVAAAGIAVDLGALDLVAREARNEVVLSFMRKHGSCAPTTVIAPQLWTLNR